MSTAFHNTAVLYGKVAFTGLKVTWDWAMPYYLAQPSLTLIGRRYLCTFVSHNFQPKPWKVSCFTSTLPQGAAVNWCNGTYLPTSWFLIGKDRIPPVLSIAGIIGNFLAWHRFPFIEFPLTERCEDTSETKLLRNTTPLKEIDLCGKICKVSSGNENKLS